MKIDVIVSDKYTIRYSLLINYNKRQNTGIIDVLSLRSIIAFIDK